MTPSDAAQVPAASAKVATLPVRRLTVADLAACVALATDRDWPPEQHKWRLLLSAGQGFGIDAPPGDSRGGLIASVVATRYGDGRAPGADAREGAISCLSMVLVAARYARRGIGLRLVAHAATESGADASFLTATEAGRPLYERLGFRAVGKLTTLRGPFRGAPPAGRAGGARVRRATAADLPGVLAYDLPVFGADRTGLLARLPSFADQLLVAERDAGGPLTGFAAAWPNVRSTVIGPVVADDLPTARALITRLAAGAPDGLPLRLDVDARHPELDAWLRAAGLAPVSVTSLMVRGRPDLPGDAARRFAPYSVALG